MSDVITLLELSGAQIEQLERETGVPINRWHADAPKGDLIPRIIALVRGEDLAELKARPLGELLDRVDLGGREPAGNAPGATS